MKHTEAYDNFIMHYGRKGMKWHKHIFGALDGEGSRAAINRDRKNEDQLEEDLRTDEDAKGATTDEMREQRQVSDTATSISRGIEDAIVSGKEFLNGLFRSSGNEEGEDFKMIQGWEDPSSRWAKKIKTITPWSQGIFDNEKHYGTTREKTARESE